MQYSADLTSKIDTPVMRKSCRRTLRDFQVLSIRPFDRIGVRCNIVFLIILLCSCEKNHAFEKELINSNSCWEYYDHIIKDHKHNTAFETCTKFNANHTYETFILKKKKIETIESIEGEPDYQGEWEYNASNNTLRIDGNVFKIKSSMGDTIVLLGNNSMTHLLVNIY